MGKMVNKYLNKSGFGIVLIVVAVVVIVSITASSVLIYRHSHNKKLASTTSTTSASTSSPTQSSSTSQPTAQQYLVIKEWGVQIPLSDSIKDAYYVVATNSSETMWLGVKSLDSTCPAIRANDTSAGGANAAISALIRVSPTDVEPVQGKPYPQLYPGATVGNYYYAYINQASNSKCASTATLQSIDSGFSTAVKSTVSDTVQ